MIRPLVQQLVLARLVDSVVERGSPAGTELIDSGGQQLRIVGKILRDVAVSIEAENESLIVSGTQDVLQEAERRFLFKIKPAAHRAAGVHQQSHVDRQVGIAPEVDDRLDRFVIVEKRKVALLQV